MRRQSSDSAGYRPSRLTQLFITCLVFLAPLGAAVAPVAAFGTGGDDALQSAGNTPIDTADGTPVQGSADGSASATQEPSSKPKKTNDPATHSRVGSLIGSKASSGNAVSTSSDTGGSGVKVTVIPATGEYPNAVTAVQNHGSIDARTKGRITGTVAKTALTDLANDSSVRYIKRPAPATTFDTGGEDEIHADDLHNLSDPDFSGKGATIAVIDLSEFDKNNDVYSDQVIDRRNTGEGSASSHGTKTAEIVAATAPEADLILSRVDSYADLQNEIDYLRTSTDTDVISISLGFANAGPLDGTSELDGNITQFVNDGGIFVAAAGNAADGQNWHKAFTDPDGDNYANVDGSKEVIDVNKPDSGTYSVFLQWDDYDTGGSDEDYDLQVINGDTGAVIRESTNTQDGATAPPEEATYISDTDTNPKIRIVHKSGAEDAKLTLRSFDNIGFTPHTEETSVLIPATGPDSFAVGAYGPAAYEWRQNELEAFSSGGPTTDGRLKPNILGPDGVTAGGEVTYGTSFAAPHVAGIAGIAMAEDSTLTPADFMGTAEATATPVTGAEPNNRVGYGLINGTGILSEIEHNPPTVSSYAASDTVDSNGRVSVGEQVAFSATVDDEFLKSVTVDASNIDGGSVTLTDGDGDGTYTGSTTVGSAAAEGASTSSLTASDVAGNTQSDSDSSLTVDNRVTSLSVDNGPVNPDKDSIHISGEAEAVDTVAFKITDSDGETDTVTKSISSTSFSVTIDPASLSLTSGNGQLDTGTVTVEAEQAESFSSAEQSTTFETDRTKPTVTLSDPATKQTVTSNAVIEFNFTADDTEDFGMKSATVKIVDGNGGTLVSKSGISVTDEKEETTTLTVPSATADGTYDVVVSATDAAKNTKTKTYSDRVEVDDQVTGATVTTDSLTKPDDAVSISGTATSVNDITLRITDSDGDTAIVTKSISQTDYSLSVTPSALSYSGGDGTLDDGSVTIDLEQAATVSEPEQSVSLTVDGTAPTIAVSAPSAQVEQTSGASQDITFTADDTENHGLKTATVTIEGSPSLGQTTVDVTDEGENTVAIPLPSTAPDGTYDINITTTDKAGNQQTKILNDIVLVDDKITQLSATDAFFSDSVTLSGSADSTEDLTLTVTGSSGTTTTLTKSISNSEFSVTIQTDSLKDGTSDGDITIEASQGIGQSGAEQTISATTLDTVKPQVTVDSVTPAQSPATSGDSIDVSFTPDDTQNYGISSATVEILDTNGDVVNSTTVSSLTDEQQASTTVTLTSGVEDGSYDIRVNATDVAGNTQSATNADSFTVDNVVRSISQTRNNGIYNGSALVELTGTIDATTGIEYKLSQGGSSVTIHKTVESTQYSTEIDLGSAGLTLSDGTLTIDGKEKSPSYSTMSTTSSFGGEVSTTAAIDTTAPDVTVYSVDTTTVKSGDTVTVTYSGDDTNDHGLRDGVVRLTRKGDGTVVTEQSVSVTDEAKQSTELTVPDTSNGDYNAVVAIDDTAYNTGTSSSEPITVDNSVRRIGVKSPATQIVSDSGTVTVNGTADAATQITFQLSDGKDTATVTKSISSTDYTATIDLSTLSPTGGNNQFDSGSVTISADQGGSYTSGEQTTTLTVDADAPTVAISKPSSKEVTPGDSVTVAFTPTDVGASNPTSATVKIVDDDGKILTSKSVNSLTNQSEETAKLSLPDDAATATYDIVVTATDGVGNTDNKAGVATDALTITSPETEEKDSGGDSGDDGSGGSGGGGGGGGALPAPAPEPDTETPTPKPTTPESNTSTPTDKGAASNGAKVSVTSSNKTSVEAVVEVNESDTDGKSTALIEANVESEDGSVKAESVEIETTNSGGGYNASVTASSESSSNTPTETTVGTIEVGHSVSDNDISQASFVVGVSRDRLDNNTLGTDDVALYRLHDGEWTQLATSHIRTDGDVEMFRATSPGLSTFAIASKSGDGANIQNVTISETTVFQNDKVFINTTLRNPTEESQTYTLNVQVGDDTATREVSVQAESNKTVTHVERIGDNVGGVDKEVYVNGVYAGTLEVQSSSSTLGGATGQPTTTPEQMAAETPTPANTDSQTPAQTTTTGSSGPGFTVGLTLLVSLLLTLVGLKRR